eukprot:scaffold123816_cov34-Tisochrysis_lutea.AAC.1
MKGLSSGCGALQHVLALLHDADASSSGCAAHVAGLGGDLSVPLIKTRIHANLPQLRAAKPPYPPTMKVSVL